MDNENTKKEVVKEKCPDCGETRFRGDNLIVCPNCVNKNLNNK